ALDRKKQRLKLFSKYFKLLVFHKNYPTHPGSHENASYKHIEKTAPSPGGNVFPLITTLFKLIRPINKTNVLTKFHDDWPKHVTFRVFTGSFSI
ncbi:hypothetical protein DPMN_137187, partial [Dreissena polymorpha]